MRANEKDLASKRQQEKTSVTSGLIESAQTQAEKDAEVIKAAREFLESDTFTGERFPLELAMYWKLQAGMSVNVGVESLLWYTWANRALGGIGYHVPRRLRQEAARQMCEASLEELQKEEVVQAFTEIVLAAKSQKKNQGVLKGKPKARAKVQASAPDEMVNHYWTTALWSTNDESDPSGGEPMDRNYDLDDIDPQTWDAGKKDCDEFVKMAGSLLDGEDMSTVGHDFWLTRNGHGAGFWDGDYEKEKGDKLTEISKKFGEVNLYVGDDGKIYGDGHGRVSSEKKAEAAPGDEPINPADYEGEMGEDEIAEEIIKHFGITEDEDVEEIRESVKLGQGQWGSWDPKHCGEFKKDGEEWTFFTSDDAAREVALESVKQSLKDEPELFTQSWLQNFLTVDDADVIAREDADSYIEGLDDKRIVEEAQEATGTDFKDRYDAAEEAGEDTDAIVEEAREAYADHMADEKAERMKADPIQFFVNDEGIYTVEDLLKASFISIDIDAAAEDAISTDGWAHFLSTYNGDYEETGKGLVVFRWN